MVTQDDSPPKIPGENKRRVIGAWVLEFADAQYIIRFFDDGTWAGEWYGSGGDGSSGSGGSNGGSSGGGGGSGSGGDFGTGGGTGGSGTGGGGGGGNITLPPWLIPNEEPPLELTVLIEDSFSQQDILEEQLNAYLGEDNWDFDNTVTQENAAFTNINDLLEQINSDIISQETIIEELDANRKKTRHRFLLGLFGLEIVVTQENLNSSDYTIINTTSSLYGFTLGVSWEQTDYDWTVNNNNNTVTIDVYGSMIYNLFIEGTGEVYRDSKHFRLIIDTNSGSVIDCDKLD